MQRTGCGTAVKCPLRTRHPVTDRPRKTRAATAEGTAARAGSDGHGSPRSWACTDGLLRHGRGRRPEAAAEGPRGYSRWQASIALQTRLEVAMWRREVSRGTPHQRRSGVSGRVPVIAGRVHDYPNRFTRSLPECRSAPYDVKGVPRLDSGRVTRAVEGARAGSARRVRGLLSEQRHVT
ncbi:hypothetical protein GCM10017687_81110 [Streptomyces echinatus]